MNTKILSARIIVEYDPINGEAVPDGLIASKARSLDRGNRYCFSNEAMILAVRLAVREKHYFADRIEIVYQGQSYFLNENGMFDNTDAIPAGFCDTHYNLLARIIG